MEKIRFSLVKFVIKHSERRSVAHQNVPYSLSAEEENRICFHPKFVSVLHCYCVNGGMGPLSTGTNDL